MNKLKIRVREKSFDDLINGARTGLFFLDWQSPILGDCEINTVTRSATFTIGACVTCYLKDLPALANVIGYESYAEMLESDGEMLVGFTHLTPVTVMLLASERERPEYQRLADHIEDVAP